MTSYLLLEDGSRLLREDGGGILLNEIVVATALIHIGKFTAQEPLYTLENEIIAYDSIDDSRIRANVVVVDGQVDSWTEYNRDDLVGRDTAVNAYLDLPELNTRGEVQQRAVEEIGQAGTVSSPGGTISGPMVLRTTRMDACFWIDEDGNKFETRIEGKHVEFNQSLSPFQRATIDTGVLVFCPPDAADVTYIARDTFERVDETGLGVALIGGAWTTGTNPAVATDWFLDSGIYLDDGRYLDEGV